MIKKRTPRKRSTKVAIEIIDETSEKKKSPPGTECPVCGAPNGRIECNECGWRVAELGPDYDIRSGDPVTTLTKATRVFKVVKDELKDLREQNKALMINNQKFSELIERMEAQIKTLRADAGKKYVYSYGGGGWGETGDIDTRKLYLKKKAVNVIDINQQLAEIMKLLKRYKK